MRYSLRFMAAWAVVGLASAAFAEQIDNPEYVQWSKYKAGTYASLRQTTEMPSLGKFEGAPPGLNAAAMTPQITVTTKLTEVRPEALTFEVTTLTIQGGDESETTTTRTVPAKIESATTQPAATEGMSGEMKNIKEGKDSIEVKNKFLKTVTKEYDTTVTEVLKVGGASPGRGGMTVARHIKVWSSEAVPGGLVQRETTTKVSGLGDTIVTITLVDYTIAK
jgi:hypothetical protein